MTQQIGGALADRSGNARALVVVTLLIALGLALRPLATDLWTLVVGRMGRFDANSGVDDTASPSTWRRPTPRPQRMRGYCALPLLWRGRAVGWGNLAVRDCRRSWAT